MKTEVLFLNFISGDSNNQYENYKRDLYRIKRAIKYFIYTYTPFFLMCTIFSAPQLYSQNFFNGVNSYLSPAINSHNSIVKLDEDSLKQSSWYSEVTKKIQAEEYDLTFDKKENHYISPNRKQRLLFTYYVDGFSAKPLITNDILSKDKNPTLAENGNHFKNLDDWNVVIHLANYGRDEKTLIFNGKELHINKGGASIKDKTLRIEYINNEKGMRQNFVLNKKPDGNGELKLYISIETKLQFNSSPRWIIVFG